MTARNKKIAWWGIGVVVAVLVLLYFFYPPVHKLGNKLLGRSEKEYPKPDSLKVDEFEYGAPQDLKGEIIDVPRDSLLDSLMLADTTSLFIDGPDPAPIPGFGDNDQLPPMPSDQDMPIKIAPVKPEEMPASLEDIEHYASSNATVNAKLTACRNDYKKLHDLYSEYVIQPTSEYKEIGSKLKKELLDALSQLMKVAQGANDSNCEEETAALRREVNKMKF
ncbi:MAG: hypothetical protein IKW83_10175 [Muribaculaceae bacterium]|nr:hypothetical protein [Muribaculaceae bacterium]